MPLKFNSVVTYLLIFLLSCNGVDVNQNAQDSLHIDSLAAKHPISSDELVSLFRKYSYVLFLKNSQEGGNATGFFIKKGARIFLISNYHVFTSTDTRLKKWGPSQYDSLKFTYPALTDVGKGAVDLRNIYKTNGPIFDYQRADIYAYDVSNILKKDAIINSIEGYIKPIPKNRNPKRIFTVGYGENASVIQLPIYFFSLKNNIGDTSMQMYSDGLHEVSNSYLLTPASSHGMSGSPVFYQFGDNIDSIFFAGVISSHAGNVTMVVTPTEVENELQRKEAAK
jgi:hypothetical protein